MLQAESEKLRQAWIQAVQASIASAYRESPDSYYTEVRAQTAFTYSHYTVFFYLAAKSDAWLESLRVNHGYNQV